MATAVLVGIVVLSLVAAAMAETGTFRSVIVLQNDYISFEFADQTITGGAAEGVSTIIESSGGLFVVGESSRITCMAYAKQSEAGAGNRVAVRHDQRHGRKAVHTGEAYPGRHRWSWTRGPGRWAALRRHRQVRRY